MSADARAPKGMVLLTGASGFVGSAIARALVAAGYPVRALVRPPGARATLADLPIEIIEGDIRDAQAVAHAVRGAHHVVHAAADYRLWTRDPAELRAVNVEGTRIVMEASRDAGIARIVYTSSVATLAPRPDGAPADESVPLAETQAVGAYKRSKIAAEQLIAAMIARDGLQAVIVNPSTPIGPRDSRPTPTGRIIVEAASGRIPAFVATGLNLVHVDDVAAGHLLAFEHGRIGERYILGGDNLTLAEMLAEIARLASRPPPRVRLPTAPLFPLAIVAEGIARLTGKEPFLTRDGLRMASKLMFFSSAKAERELNYRHRPAAAGLEDALTWFREAGYIR